MFQQSAAKYLQVCKYYPTSIVRVKARYERTLMSCEASMAVRALALIFNINHRDICPLLITSSNNSFLSLDKIVTYTYQDPLV